jgi:hypothetical protein
LHLFPRERFFHLLFFIILCKTCYHYKLTSLTHVSTMFFCDLSFEAC